jgi:hypothetical protein
VGDVSGVSGHVPSDKFNNPREIRDFIQPFDPNNAFFYQQNPNAYPGPANNVITTTFPQPAPQPQQPVVLATGSLDEFFNQPSVSGGPSWSFKDKPVGTTFVGVVSRPITNADIQQQTTPGSNQPATYRDGRPKWVMRVPLNVNPDQSFPDGESTWFVTGQARDELVRAMAEAGAPVGAPEAGSTISVTLVARRPSRTPGFNPSNQVSVRYTRPPVTESSPAPGGPTTESAQEAPASAPQPPGDLTPEQQALLARLTSHAAK